MPERTNEMQANFLQSTGEPLRLRLTNPSFLAGQTNGEIIFEEFQPM